MGGKARNGVVLPTNEEILTDVRKVSAEMNGGKGSSKPCTSSQYRCLGRYDGKLLKKRFGRWNEVVEAASLEPRPRKGGL